MSPWTAAIMASELLIENKDQEDDDVDSDNGSSTGMDDHSAELRTQLLRKKGFFPLFFHGYALSFSHGSEIAFFFNCKCVYTYDLSVIFLLLY